MIHELRIRTDFPRAEHLESIGLPSLRIFVSHQIDVHEDQKLTISC